MGLPEPVSGEDLRAKIVASAISTAQAAADTDYTVCGKTLKGFDCSGFVYFALKQVFPDFSYLQAADLAASPLFVEVKAYRPGDLIFFRPEQILTRLRRIARARPLRNFPPKCTARTLA
jgi:cell wall-associated NlpC family hydrolase